jgi:copper resistance protein D
VATIVLTGVINIALTSGRAPLPPATPYRAMLALKIVVVAFMIALALLNRYWLTPRIKRYPGALTVLAASSAAEIALGTTVLGLVSVFALLDPA